MMVNTKNIGFLLSLTNGILFLVLPLADISAQESLNMFTHQIWLDYSPTYQLSEKFDLKGSAGARTVFPNTWYRFWVRQYRSFDWPRLVLKKARFREQLDGGLHIYYTINKDRIITYLEARNDRASVGKITLRKVKKNYQINPEL